MTQLESVKIDGFKALSSTEIDSNGINIITGRNNTGKTSVLESIDLLLNPKNLSDYDSHLSGLINIHRDGFEMTCNYANVDERDNVTLRHPDSRRALTLYTDSLSTYIESEGSRRYYLPRFADNMEVVQRFQEVVVDNLPDMINATPDEIKDEIIDNTYIMTYNGKDYPYVFYGGYFRDFFNYLFEERSQEMLDEIESLPSINPGQEADWGEMLRQYLERLFRIHYREGQFIEVPQGRDRFAFIKSAKVDRQPSRRDEEGRAVKKTKIRDYLREHGIVEGLEDFDFDELVIEDENGERNEIHYEFMGDGFKSIVGILWRLIEIQEQTDIILLEEPENNMHPGYIDELVPFLLDVAIDKKKQLFITTHNVDFIRAFLSDDLDSDSKKYLESNFQIVQMTKSVPKVLDYEHAKEDLEELHIDLRGI